MVGELAVDGVHLSLLVALQRQHLALVLLLEAYELGAAVLQQLLTCSQCINNVSGHLVGEGHMRVLV